MEISPAEAINLLRKWREETRVVSAVLKSSHGLSYTLGKITDFSQESVTVSSAGSRLPLGEAFSATVSLVSANYDYVEGRHASSQFPKLKGYDALLTIMFDADSSFSAGLAVMPAWEDILKQ